MKPEMVHAKRILLIDDIYTTGATANECAKTLLNGGASRIDVLTIARAVWLYTNNNHMLRDSIDQWGRHSAG